MVVELNAILDSHRTNFDLLQEMAKEYKMLCADHTKIPTKKYRKLIEKVCAEQKNTKKQKEKQKPQKEENLDTTEKSKLLSSVE